ncbi:MAG: hypothetical protein K2Y32_02585 [Candidatus Obscuribacterales bacterium]|nr:hypothetical protein [Candidatus Obscuribacterales bacterium]
MGYDLHVTRKEFWADEDGPQILFGEWSKLVELDPDLELDSQNDGSYFIFHHPTENVLFAWRDTGEITSKNPDKMTLAKLLQIATKLKAQVQGDDGEIYSRLEDMPD